MVHLFHVEGYPQNQRQHENWGNEQIDQEVGSESIKILLDHLDLSCFIQVKSCLIRPADLQVIDIHAHCFEIVGSITVTRFSLIITHDPRVIIGPSFFVRILGLDIYIFLPETLHIFIHKIIDIDHQHYETKEKFFVVADVDGSGAVFVLDGIINISIMRKILRDDLNELSPQLLN